MSCFPLSLVINASYTTASKYRVYNSVCNVEKYKLYSFFPLAPTCQMKFQRMPVYEINSDRNLHLHSPVVADLNGDGQRDLAVLSARPSSVRVLFGNGNGTFGSQTTAFDAFKNDSRALNSLAVGDFNNDSQLDLVFTNCDENYVRVLLGNGTEAFRAQMISSTGNNTCPEEMIVADFNSDNKSDVVVVHNSNHNVGVLLGNGNGTLATETIFPTGYDSFPVSVNVGDFNGDGYLDITFVNYASRQVGVFLGHGDGAFEARKMFSMGIGQRPYSIAVGDFNGDTHLDVVYSYNGQNAVSMLFGYGNGTFGAKAKFVFETPSFSWSNVVVGDFNGDRHLDITIGFLPPHTVNVLLGYGNGIFEAQTIFSTKSESYGPVHVAVGDFNDDDCQDIVTTNVPAGTMNILLNTCECCAHEICERSTFIYPRL